MIVLITGASHVGKTLLAQGMLEKNAYIDAIRYAMLDDCLRG